MEGEIIMNDEKLLYYKKILIEEKKQVNDLMELLNRNGVVNSNSEMASEISFYDNHPSDLATELFDKEKGLAIKANEISTMKDIDDSLKNIENKSYGKCKRCGNDIPEERLNFLPYTNYCVECKDKISLENSSKEVKSSEKNLMDEPFGYGYNDSKDDNEFDAEDSYQKVDSFNQLKNIYESDEEEDEDIGFVEDIEKVSNQQYKNGLPD